MRKKCADKLRTNRASDQRLCFRYIYSTIPLHFQPLRPSSVDVQPGLCWTWWVSNSGLSYVMSGMESDQSLQRYVMSGQSSMLT